MNASRFWSSTHGSDRWFLFSANIRTTTVHLHFTNTHSTQNWCWFETEHVLFEHRKTKWRLWHVQPQRSWEIFWRITLLWNFTQRHREAFCEFVWPHAVENWPADTLELRFHFMVSWFLSGCLRILFPFAFFGSNTSVLHPHSTQKVTHKISV